MKTPRAARAGFTLAEVAVTVAIVAIALVVSLQSLEGAKLTAAHTRNLRLARELGLLTLHQIGAGLHQEDIESGTGGTYAEEDYPEFYYEIALGDDTFIETDPNEGPFDNWAYQEELRRQQDDYDEELEEDVQEEFEKVRIKVTFPPIKEFTRELILEQWVPWEQVYGEDPDLLEDEGETGEDPAGGGGGGGGADPPAGPDRP